MAAMARRRLGEGGRKESLFSEASQDSLFNKLSAARKEEILISTAGRAQESDVRSRNVKRLLSGTVVLLAFVGSRLPAQSAGEPTGSWFFALSGDSRDCGDVIMPRIAAAIAARRAKAPVAFYWHLGDFRRVYEPDCDLLKTSNPAVDCPPPRKPGPFGSHALDDYLKVAWTDFIDRQIRPFGATPVFLGIGNHELYGGQTRDDFRHRFRRWLTQEPIHSQRQEDWPNGAEGDTYYHFVHRNVDFVSLDNADGVFDQPQIAWLGKVLDKATAKKEIAAIVVGMHAALPNSSNRYHALDSTCSGRCSGNAVYDMLVKASAAKKVYVFASHSHRFAANVYDQPEHQGHVLDGWIIGTAGAVQSLAPDVWPAIRYGYLEVEVQPTGVVIPNFKEVRRDSRSAATRPERAALLDFCFNANKQEARPDSMEKDCKCPESE